MKQRPPYRLLVAACLAALLAAPARAQTSAPPRSALTAASSDPARRYAAAVAAARAHDYPRAIALCRQIVRDAPTAAPVWATLARLLSETGDNKGALAAGRKAASLAPGNAAFRADLADFNLRVGKPAEAEADARAALTLEPKNDLALATLATRLLEARDDAGALPVMIRLQAVRGGKNRALMQNIVATQMRLGKPKDALATARAFARALPQDREAAVAVCELCLQARDLAGVRAEADALEKVDSKSPLPWYYRGRAAATGTAGRADERLRIAERAFREAVDRAPGVALFRAELGVMQLGQGGERLGAAHANLVGALVLDNHQPIAWRGLCALNESAKNWREAATDYDAILRLAPDSKNELRRRYAGILLLADRKAAAYAQFRQLALREPENVTYLKELASFLLADKRYAEARGAYAQVLERSTDDPDAPLGIAQCFAAEGKKAEARAAYEKAITADPKRDTAYLLLAASYKDDKDEVNATKVLERLVAAAPASNAGRWQLIEEYERAHRYPDAAREIARLTLSKSDPNRIAYRLAEGNLALLQNDVPGAVSSFERVASEEPESPAVALALASAYDRANRAADAQTAYETAARLAESALRKADTPEMRDVLSRARAGETPTNRTGKTPSSPR